MSNLSPELTRYLIWAGAVVLGVVLCAIDRRWLGRWIFGCLLVAGVAGGLLVTVVSPFRFGGTSYFMEGVIVSGGSALALIGYAAGLVWQRVFRHIGTSRS